MNGTPGHRGRNGLPEDGPDSLCTRSGIALSRIYSADVSVADYSRCIGEPGQFPYTRGIRAGAYRQRAWTMRQYAGYGTAAETNRRFRYLLENGVTGLSVAFDLPTQMGLDSDDPLAAGEVGRVGVAIDTVDDMRSLFDCIPLGQVSTSMTINSTASILLAMYVAVAEEQGVDPAELGGTVQNDILKEFIARGTQIYPLRASLRLVTDVIEYCRRRLPRWNSISISGYHIREAGATAVDELAFTFGNAISYVEHARTRGLEVDDFAPRLSFFFAVHNEFLEEVAKFRAARRLWARLLRERFGARDPRSMMLRFHAQTAGSTLTAQFPDGNIVRTSLQTLAAVLGGAQSIHTNSKDEALAIPSEEAARLALRTQQIIAGESNVREMDDPLGGSFAIEALTDAVEAAVWERLERIDARGGMLSAIESGFVVKEIEDSAYRYQRDVESGRSVIVGINRFRLDGDAGPPIRIHRADPVVEAHQSERLRKVKAGRDAVEVERHLADVRDAALAGANVMPAVLEAVRSRATVGEISGALGEVFGRVTE